MLVTKILIATLLNLAACKPAASSLTSTTSNKVVNHLHEASYQITCAKLQEPTSKTPMAMLGCQLQKGAALVSFEAELSSWKWTYIFSKQQNITVAEVTPEQPWQYAITLKNKMPEEELDNIIEALSQITIDLRITPIDAQTEIQLSSSL